MKKLLSLVLALTMISSCLAITSCNLIGEIFGTTGTTTTTTGGGDPAPVTFEHGENFTEDDIEFVRMLHGRIMTAQDDSLGFEIPVNYSLYDALSCAQNHGMPLLLMKFDNPYIICAYQKPNITNYEVSDDGTYLFDITRYVWRKYSVEDEIPEIFGDCSLSKYSYLLYDCTISKDIVNGTIYNKQCKYYLNYSDKESIKMLSQYMLFLEDGIKAYTDDSKFIKHSDYGVGHFNIHIHNDQEYLLIHEQILQNDIVISDMVSKQDFKDYYNIFSPHFVFFEELDYSYEYNDNLFVKRYAGLDLNVLIETLIK